MTATKQFIEDAIKGGWRDDGFVQMIGDRAWSFSLSLTPESIIPVQEILLDPLAWKAVGKTRGWDSFDAVHQETYHMSGAAGEMPKGMYGWCQKMHRFIDHLAKGKTIEEVLSAIK